MLDSKVRLLSLLVCLVLCVSSQAWAQSVADLELRAPAQDVVAGTTFEVDLYAVANPGPAQDVGDVRAILSWNDSVFLFTGTHIDTGHDWQQSGFFTNPDGLNDDVSDGLAVYRAIAVPSEPASADTNGLLVTTFEFTALVATSPATSAINILASAGATPTASRVLDGAGADVTGALIGDSVTTVVCSDVADCYDADECTDDSCSGGICSYELNYDPGSWCCNPLTGFDQPIDDGNDCTYDFCDPDGSVRHENKPFDTFCDEPDDLPCSFQDTCNSTGTCLPNDNIDGTLCNEDGDECTHDHCQSGECVVDWMEPDGTNCDDGQDACTPGQDTCQGGACTGATDPCPPERPFCEEDAQGLVVCHVCRMDHPEDCPAIGCNLPFCFTSFVDPWRICWDSPQGCDDGQFCNGIETCNVVTGLCDPDPDPQICVIDPNLPFCDEEHDTCEVCLVDDDCSNGLMCDGVDTCDAAVTPHVCYTGTPVVCPPDEVCTGYECQEPDGCVQVPINEDLEVCDDDDGCTVRDACQNGTCVGRPPTGLGGVSLEFRLPDGAPTRYDLYETVEVDLIAVLDNSIKSCEVSATACTFSTDCPTNEACLFPTSHHFRLVETVFKWDPAALEIDASKVLDPCTDCDACSIGCSTDADCTVDVVGVDDCLCPFTGAPPPCPPGTDSAVCRHLFSGYPEECPAVFDPDLCRPECPPGQFDWGASIFAPPNYDSNGLNEELCSEREIACVYDDDCGICADGSQCNYNAQDCLDGSTCVLSETCSIIANDGDAYYLNQPAFGPRLAEVTTAQDLWVARFSFTVVGGGGAQTSITFDECTPEAAQYPTMTRVLGPNADPVTGSLLLGVSFEVGGCSDPLCDDGEFCTGVETCSTPNCTPGEPGCCLPGTFPCFDGDECTTDDCDEGSDTCSYSPYYDPAEDCCDPATGDLTPLQNANPCTEGICDPDTGDVTQIPLPQYTPCDDNNTCTHSDECDGAGTCAGTLIPDCTECQTDGDCDDLIDCTINKCVGDTCAYTPDDSLCPDNGVYCDGREFCHADLDCISTGDPCWPECDEQGTPHCPCEAPLFTAAGSRYLKISPQPLDSDVPVKLRVDWPGGDSPCLSKYVGALGCGGLGEACATDADCNECSFTHVPCLTDQNCVSGLCTNGSECLVSQQNCLDQSECLRNEYCMISGDLCEAAPLGTFDVNQDGLIDGTMGVLVDEAFAAELTPIEWTAGVMRCSKSVVPCVDDDDCTRGRCVTTGFECSVPDQSCYDGALCVVDEECLPGGVYVYGDDIVPSEWEGAPMTGHLLPNVYDAVADCGVVTTEPVSITMWRWCDTNNDKLINVKDVAQVKWGIYRVYEFSNIATNDMTGTLGACWVQQIINVSDLAAVLRAAVLEEHYYEQPGCYMPTCP